MCAHNQTPDWCAAFRGRLFLLSTAVNSQMCQNTASKKLFQIISRTERGLENAQDDFNGKTGKI